MGEENTENENVEIPAGSWMDGIDDSYRSDPTISKHTDLNSLMKEHVGAQAMLGRKGLVIPKEGDDETVYSSYREALGVPTSAEAYTLEGFSPNESLQWDKDFQGVLNQVAHEESISDKGLARILSTYAEWAQGKIDGASGAASELTSAQLQTLKEEFGGTYEAKTGAAAAALNSLTSGDPGSVANQILSDGTKLGDNPGFIKVMAQVGASMAEKGLIGEKVVNTGGMTPEEAQKALDKLEGNRENFESIFNDPYSPDHKELVAERERLLQYAYPEE